MKKLTILIVFTILVGCRPYAMEPTIAGLNTQYAETASAPAPLPTDVPTITATFTFSISEVTVPPATPTPGIIEVGTPENHAPAWGDPIEAPGTLTIYAHARNIRACPSLTCDVIGSVSAWGTMRSGGYIIDSTTDWWACQRIVTDAHGAMLCENAVLYHDADGAWGRYEIDPTPTPVVTPTLSPTPFPTPSPIVQGASQ